MKKIKNFWQRLKDFIIRPKKEITITLDKKALPAIRQAVRQELAQAISATRQGLDKKLIGQVVAELTKEIPKARELAPLIKPRKITIKESFINPMDEGVKLKPGFTRKPKGKKISGGGLEASLKALKKYQ